MKGGLDQGPTGRPEDPRGQGQKGEEPTLRAPQARMPPANRASAYGLNDQGAAFAARPFCLPGEEGGNSALVGRPRLARQAAGKNWENGGDKKIENPTPAEQHISVRGRCGAPPIMARLARRAWVHCWEGIHVNVISPSSLQAPLARRRGFAGSYAVLPFAQAPAPGGGRRAVPAPAGRPVSRFTANSGYPFQCAGAAISTPKKP